MCHEKDVYYVLFNGTEAGNGAGGGDIFYDRHHPHTLLLLLPRESHIGVRARVPRSYRFVVRRPRSTVIFSTERIYPPSYPRQGPAAEGKSEAEGVGKGTPSCRGVSPSYQFFKVKQRH